MGICKNPTTNMLTGERLNKAFPATIRNETRLFTHTTSTQHSTRSSSQAITQQKEKKKKR